MSGDPVFSVTLGETLTVKDVPYYKGTYSPLGLLDVFDILRVMQSNVPVTVTRI